MSMEERLREKVAIITGGGSGMGRAACLLFAREGARVVAADLNEAGARETVASIGREGGTALAVGCDVSRAADVRALLQSTLKSYGQLDILFNNAGRHLPKDVEATSEDEWDDLLATNLRSVFLTVKYAAAELKRRRGVIINMASMVALLGQANAAAYAASKGGIVALTKSLALDYAPYGVRVNCICPAGVATPLLERWIEEQADPQATRAALDRIHPLGWTARPEEIAAAALFLASEEASFITGVALPVEGGAALGYRG
jgi:NAD(P)-dependent dehydrogenase (short-subunit alcohol dehydrogenase family)